MQSKKPTKYIVITLEELEGAFNTALEQTAKVEEEANRLHDVQLLVMSRAMAATIECLAHEIAERGAAVAGILIDAPMIVGGVN